MCSYFAAALCLVGFARSARRRWHTVHTYALVYAGLLLVWPFDTTRFMVPWSPFLIYFVFVGIRAGAWRVFKLKGVKATLLLAFVLLVVNFHHDLAKMHLSTPERYFCREYVMDFADLDQVSLWVQANTPEDAVLASHHFGALYLETGRRGYPPWPAGNPYDVFVGTEREAATFYRHPAPGEQDLLHADMEERFVDVYREAGVTHYVEWANGHETAPIRRVMEAHPGWLEHVYTTPVKTDSADRRSGGSFRVFQVRVP